MLSVAGEFGFRVGEKDGSAHPGGRHPGREAQTDKPSNPWQRGAPWPCKYLCIMTYELRVTIQPLWIGT